MEDTLCYQNQSDLYLYHPTEKTSEKYMNFTESGISGARVYQTGLLSDGSIAALERDYRDGEFSYVLHLLKEITEIVEEEAMSYQKKSRQKKRCRLYRTGYRHIWKRHDRKKSVPRNLTEERDMW